MDCVIGELPPSESQYALLSPAYEVPPLVCKVHKWQSRTKRREVMVPRVRSSAVVFRTSKDDFSVLRWLRVVVPTCGKRLNVAVRLPLPLIGVSSLAYGLSLQIIL